LELGFTGSSLGFGIGLWGLGIVRELPVRNPRELVTLSWVAGKRVPFEGLNGTGDI
jgi:hypothetical protein